MIGLGSDNCNAKEGAHFTPPPPQIGLNHFWIVFLNHIQRPQPIFKILWAAEIWIWKSFSIEFNHEVKGSKFQHKGFLKVLFSTSSSYPRMSTSVFLILFDITVVKRLGSISVSIYGQDLLRFQFPPLWFHYCRQWKESFGSIWFRLLLRLPSLSTCPD